MRCGGGRYSGIRSPVRLAAAVLLTTVPAIGMSVEIAPFKLTDTEGAVELRYLFREREVASVDGRYLFERRPIMEQQVNFRTQGYVYHPSFLDLELSGSVRAVQQSLESSYEESSDSSLLYDIGARFHVLKNKPYPLTLYYLRNNPSEAIGLADRLALEGKSYGFNFSLLDPLTPFPVNLQAEHRELSGAGASRVVDDTVDRFSAAVQGRFGENGFGRLGYSEVHQESASGSLFLPIRSTWTNTRSVDWNGRFTLGGRDQFGITNLITYTAQEQSDVADRNDLRVLADVTWDHGSPLRSYYRYALLRGEIGEDVTVNQNVSAGFSYSADEGFGGALGVDGSREESPGFEANSYGFSGSLDHRRHFGGYGEFRTGYTLGYRENAQRADQERIDIVGERLVLAGTGAVPLGNEYAVTDTVVVSSELRTQVFVENVDYRLLTVGTEVRIQRLASGGIEDGQIVLVDYAFLSGGTFDYNNLSQSVNLRYTFAKHYGLYARYAENRQKLINGTPSRPLNSSEALVVGSDAGVPLGGGMEFGWLAEREERFDDINPFTRDTLDLYLNLSLPFSTFALLNARYERVENQRSMEDVNLRRYGITLRSQPWLRTDVLLELSKEEDTGGVLARRIDAASLAIAWRRRQLRIGLEAKYVSENQGEYRREDASIRATVTRQIR